MKKWLLLLIFSLIIQAGYRVTPVSADSKEDATAVKTVIENYLESNAKGDLNAAMSQISTKYSSFDKDRKAIDYKGFKSNLENFLKRVKNASITDLKISNLNVVGDKATLDAAYNFKGVNLETSKNISIERIVEFSLVKVNGSWKISKISPKQKS